MLKTQIDARRFFAAKVIQRAVVEGAPLSEDERHMLFWSETEPDPIADPVLAERLAASICDADYETKVIRLLERSLGADVATNASAIDAHAG